MDGAYDQDNPPERFIDSPQMVKVPWTAELALRVARVDASLPREQQVDQLRDAIDDEDGLPEAAVDALITAGWHELDD